MPRPQPLRLAALAAALALGLGAPAFAQTLADIEAAEAALAAAWEATPLTFRRALFVSGEGAEFGRYTPHEGAVFAPGEPIRVYAEPVGFGWSEGPGGYHAGFAIDMIIRRPDGVALLEKPDFMQAGLDGPTRNRDFMLLMTLELSGAEPGDYRLDYTVRDEASGEAALISLPFSIAAPAPLPAAAG
jgi:hypothetical protein